jgi:hypothetical protein
VHSQTHMFPECYSRLLLSAASSAQLRGVGAASQLPCSIHIGPSCTTCVAPALNGERNTHETRDDECDLERLRNYGSALLIRHHNVNEGSEAIAMLPRSAWNVVFVRLSIA